MVVLALFQATGGHCRAEEDAYFPELIFLPRNGEVNSIIDKMTSVHLRAMQEPSLWAFSRRDRTAVVYRFLWFPRAGHPVCLRLTRADRTFRLRVASHDGPSGVTAGRQTLDREVRLTVPQGERLVGLIERTPFWTAPVEVRENQGIADGDGIVIEGVKGGRYHVINRAGTAAGEAYEAFCRSLLELAGEPQVVTAWDRARRDEREVPGYRPEPPQTEDRGDYGSDDPDGSTVAISGASR
jgi:bifunctional DNA-binding transcriptional regulator/antitoxin component of YhaV-PrlF toxin-antitoxin module